MRAIVAIGVLMGLVVGCSKGREGAESSERDRKREATPPSEAPVSKREAAREPASCPDPELWTGQECVGVKELQRRICADDRFCADVVAAKHQLVRRYRRANELERRRVTRARVGTHEVEPRLIEETVADSMRLVPVISAAKESEKKTICRTWNRGFGREVQCVEIDLLAAYLQPNTAVELLQDVHALEEINPAVDKEHDTLLDCGRSRWTSFDKEGDGAVTKEDEQEIGQVCALLDERLDPEAVDGMVAAASQAGMFLSGVSGLNAVPEICGLGLDWETDQQKFTADAIARAERMLSACASATGGAGTLMAGGGAGTTGEPSPPPKDETDAPKKIVSADGKTVTTISGDGKTVETKVHNDNGSTTTTKTTTSTNGAEVVTVTHDDPANPNANYSLTTTTQTTSDGTIVTAVYDDPSDPSNNFTETTVSNANGTTVTIDYEDGSGRSTTTRPDGTGTSYLWGPRDGSGKKKGFSVDFDANGPIQGSTKPFAEPRLVDPEKDPDELDLVPIRQRCLEPELCADCEAFGKSFEDIKAACEGGDLLLCREFGEEAQCCNGGEVGDPRLVIPSPQGGFECTSGMKAETALTYCKMQCSLMDSVGCEERCVGDHAGSRRIESDPMTIICAEAIWDACFGSEGPGASAGGSPSPPLPFRIDTARNISIFADSSIGAIGSGDSTPGPDDP